MTIVVIWRSVMTWAATQAKAKFSEVLDRAETSGPQLVKRRKREFLIITKEDFAAQTTAKVTEKPFVSGWDALAPSSGATFDVDFPRSRSKGRAVKF
jgi:prevent-host-death family protein